jgi:purine-binding chemotaxis protein CheW
MQGDKLSGRETDRIRELVAFRVGSEEYAVDIQKVHEINRFTELIALPHAPEFIQGILNLRGRVIPVMSLRKRFGLSDQSQDADTRILVTEIAGRVVGFMVDSVSEVLRLPIESISPAPQLITNGQAEYLSGVGKSGDRLWVLLDLERMLSTGEMHALQKAA